MAPPAGRYGDGRCPLPPVSKRRPSQKSGRDWWRLDDDLTMVRIRLGAVRREIRYESRLSECRMSSG